MIRIRIVLLIFFPGLFIYLGCAGSGPDEYYNTANKYMEVNKYLKAKLYYTKSISLNPNEPNYWYGRGLANYYLGELSAAEVDFNATLMINGDYADAYISLGMIYLDEQNYKDALNAFNNGIEKAPTNSIGYQNRGELKYEILDIKGAVEDYLKVVELDPNSTVALNNVATLYNYMGDWDKANIYANNSLSKGDSSPQIYANLGYALLEKKEYDRAANILDYAINIYPEYAECYKHRGELKKGRGDEEGGFADLRKALELDPDYPKELINRAKGRIDIGFIDGAIEDLDLVIFYNHNLGEAFYWRGVAKERKGDKRGSEEDYTKAEEINPDIRKGM